MPNVSDDCSSSNQSGNSPNLSVSDWADTCVMHDDQNSDKSSSSQKNLLSSNEHSLNINKVSNMKIMTSSDISSISKQFHSLTSPEYERAHINSLPNYESYQNYAKSKFEIFFKIPIYKINFKI